MDSDTKALLIALGMLLASLTTCSVADSIWRTPPYAEPPATTGEVHDEQLPTR